MMKKHIFKACIMIASSAVMLPLMAATQLTADINAGKTIANQGGGAVAPCMTCHGANGEGMGISNFPRLAGSSQYYLRKQLEDFKSGKRQQALMQPMAAGLNDQQILNVSAYYASLPTPNLTKPAVVDPAIYAAGEQLAENGDIARQLVACANCHGPRGIGLPPAIPALIGQSSGYIEAQLNAWQSGNRKNDDGGLMTEVASNLTAEDIAAVAAYYSSVRQTESTP
ncbi:c-type cytochrome [Shewanella psychrotolerans]|uniref:c-type cytochrome n=1 Tax=Shewanella psychrotolerans TaxID=2864206 RepID=UPI001C65B118|nr:c-type cytochrome [Shewanella psychrotolerans]QYK02293.1 cytochrome c4 [Shewanella psychrotolerans]